MAVTGGADIAVAAVAAAAGLVLGGCLRPEEAYGVIRWKVLVLLAGVIPLGAAIGTTGLAGDFTQVLLHVAAAVGWRGGLAALGIATALLTQAHSNVAATAVMTPVAIRLASGIGLPAKACVAVVLGAAICTPLSTLASKPTILVRGAGGYRTADYIRLGPPFAIAALALAVVAAPALWPPAPA